MDKFLERQITMCFKKNQKIQTTLYQLKTLNSLFKNFFTNKAWMSAHITSISIVSEMLASPIKNIKDIKGTQNEK